MFLQHEAEIRRAISVVPKQHLPAPENRLSGQAEEHTLPKRLKAKPSSTALGVGGPRNQGDDESEKRTPSNRTPRQHWTNKLRKSEEEFKVQKIWDKIRNCKE